MTVVAQIMLWVFIAAWLIGAAAHIYATRFFLPLLVVRFRKRPQHEGYGRKALLGYGIFVAALAVGFAAGGIAELAGGWS